MTSGDLPRILQIPAVGARENFILVHVSPTGRHTHDLKLIGTDGSDVYSVKIKHNQTSTLTTKNFSGTQAQWEEILSAVLLGVEEGELTKGVEAVAKVRPDYSIIITIQKSIEGIKQKYGTITLAPTPDEEISMFDWCALIAESNEDSRKELADLNASLRGKDREVEELKKALSELKALKDSSEDDLVEKFSKLLNEKKLKIRDQQRLLSSAKVDPAKLDEVERTRIPERETPPAPSRRGKRKAARAVEDESDDETDDRFEKMDVDAEHEVAEIDRNSADEQERQTEDESTADEDSEAEADVQLPTRNENNAKATGSGMAAQVADVEAPPPKRDLPFGKKPAAPAPTPAVDEGSETESDDEL